MKIATLPAKLQMEEFQTIYQSNGRIDSERYIQDILAYHMIPFLKSYNGDYLFHQDTNPY